MGSFFRGEFGQYFTPRVIVQFIVEALPIKNTSLVLDTSCGSGGFLLHALDKVRRQADEEYPDKDSDNEEKEGWKEYWHNFAQKNLYGIEINEQIARTAKMNMIIHDDGHTNVISVDGLLNEKDVYKFTSNKGFQYNRFNFIITNPPFGSSVKQNEKHYLETYFLGEKNPDWLDYKNTKTEVRNNQSTEVLFIEQCYNYLAENGYLAVVIPDGILTNSSLQYVRDAIEDWYRIVAVISLPQTAFTATGEGIKSSVLFLRKYSKKHTTNLRDLKTAIQNSIKADFDYFNQIDEWNQEKAEIIKTMDGFTHPDGLTTVKEIKASDEFKEWRTEINQQYAEKLTELQEQMQERYQEERAKQLPDYSIFMAIAENIGYDASGKNSAKLINKEEIIEGNYKKVIEHLSHDLYDEEVTKKYDKNNEKEELSTKKIILQGGILKELTNFIKAVDNGSI